jgi:hypothetical protein
VHINKGLAYVAIGAPLGLPIADDKFLVPNFFVYEMPQLSSVGNLIRVYVPHFFSTQSNHRDFLLHALGAKREVDSFETVNMRIIFQCYVTSYTIKNVIK